MEASFSDLLFCSSLYFVSLLLLYKAYLKKPVSRIRVFLAIIAFATACVFNYISGDYYHYKAWFEIYSIIAKSNIEDVYSIIASYTSSYSVFRMIVWGGALLLFLYTCKLVKIDFALLFFIFVSRYFIVFSYARVSLCMAICFCGFAMMSQLWEKKFLMGLLGVAVMGLSVYFHKTGVMAIGICLLSVLILKQNRINIVLLIILLPLLIYLISSFVNLYQEAEFSETSIMIEGGQRYLEGGASRYSSFTKNVVDIIWRIPYFVLMVIYIKMIHADMFNTMPVYIRLFANASVLSVLISFLFLIVPGINSFVLYYRLINFAMIPSVIFVTYCYTNNICMKLVKAFYYMSVWGVTLKLAFKIVISIMY